MGATDRSTATSQVLKIDGTDISGLREFSLDKNIDLVDASAGTELSKSYVAALRDATGSFKYVYEGTQGDQPHTALLEPDGTLRSFQYGPEGSLAGTHACDSGSLYIKSHPITATYDGLIEMTVNFQVSGDMIKNRETDVW